MRHRDEEVRVLTKQDRFLNIYQDGSDVKTGVHIDLESAQVDAGILKRRGASMLMEQVKVQITLDMEAFFREHTDSEEFGTWNAIDDKADICCVLGTWEFTVESTKELIKWLHARVAHTESLKPRGEQ